ncbi:hypothetical protein OGAPHI_003231 [Ogataea philodendri]|uniref:Uncharacterized protein n=1 Tax=Ogataea philodendri TaxID=1378263 RepID=A0A9P8P7J0_9ASCO|nr:uncharacterized protein OGAPHI_003231 [Ogataea philodendri]KAH3666782.1 hypothetical protein OGAPHI_003231 [Ogataea philodendri]
MQIALVHKPSKPVFWKSTEHVFQHIHSEELEHDVVSVRRAGLLVDICVESFALTQVEIWNLCNILQRDLDLRSKLDTVGLDNSADDVKSKNRRLVLVLNVCKRLHSVGDQIVQVVGSCLQKHSDIIVDKYSLILHGDFQVDKLNHTSRKSVHNLRIQIQKHVFGI